MSLALVQTTDRNVNQLQQNVAAVLNPVASNPLVNGQLLRSQALTLGTNVIQHGLGRQLIGYFVTRTNGYSGTVYDTAATASTLTLVSSQQQVFDIYVF